MTDHTLQPGYKLLKDMVTSKKSAQVKAFWITATDENQTNVRLCLAKLKEERLKLERKLREIEKFHERALVVEGLINTYDSQRSSSFDESQTDELAPTKKARNEATAGGGGIIGAVSGALGFGAKAPAPTLTRTTTK